MEFLTKRCALAIATCLVASAASSIAAEPPLRLTAKPVLCVLDKDATSCRMSFDIRWKSVLAGEYCLNDSFLTAPLRCWASARAGDTRVERVVSEDFLFWLGAPTESEHLAEVKVSVLRVGSTDRRRERRTRHVWDVL
ncbi:MAG: DUF3019 domain-containing protein [Steroidobacteraceae bacterium]|nr:DUF3019 domain-containing protein [Steroidobacteraceae bacterium]